MKNQQYIIYGLIAVIVLAGLYFFVLAPKSSSSNSTSNNSANGNPNSYMGYALVRSNGTSVPLDSATMAGIAGYLSTPNLTTYNNLLADQSTNGATWIPAFKPPPTAAPSSPSTSSNSTNSTLTTIETVASTVLKFL